MNRSIFEISPTALAVAVLTLTGLAPACATAPELEAVRVRAPLPAPITTPAAGSVHLAPTIDARPASLRTDRGPFIESHYAVLAAGTGSLFIQGARTEGPSLRGGELLVLEGPAGRIGPAALLDAMTSQLLGAAGIALDARLELGDVAAVAAATGVRDGIVVVPVLDQLDLTRMSSVNSMSGGSSSETGRSATTVTYTQTSGAARLAAATPSFANMRARLLVLEMAGGAVRSSRWVYGRGAGPTLDVAIAHAGAMLGQGLSALWAPPAPSSPEPTPSTSQGATP